MRVSSSLRVPMPRGVSIACLGLALAFNSIPANAQLGALRRAAERRVEQKAEDRVQVANLIAPQFDSTTLEITPARLDTYTAAMERVQAMRAQRQQEYAALNNLASAQRDTAERMFDREESRAYEQASTRYSACRNEAREAAERESERKMQEFAERMQRNPIGMQSDPKVKSMVALMQEISTAQTRGDQAASDRAAAKLHVLMGITASDSASIDRAVTPRCGARPTKPASLLRHAAMRLRADSTEERARSLQGGGGVRGADVGMSQRQSRMFWERVASWLNGMSERAPITRTFTREEYDLLVQRRGALRKAFSGA
jgi:hypothetical protein